MNRTFIDFVLSSGTPGEIEIDDFGDAKLAASVSISRKLVWATFINREKFHAFSTEAWTDLVKENGGKDIVNADSVISDKSLAPILIDCLAAPHLTGEKAQGGGGEMHGGGEMPDTCKDAGVKLRAIDWALTGASASAGALIGAPGGVIGAAVGGLIGGIVDGAASSIGSDNISAREAECEKTGMCGCTPQTSPTPMPTP